MMMKYYAKKQEIQCKLSLIKDKKRKFLQEKLSQNIGKPKELWKIIKKNWVFHTERLPQQAYASI